MKNNTNPQRHKLTHEMRNKYMIYKKEKKKGTQKGREGEREYESERALPVSQPGCKFWSADSPLKSPKQNKNFK